MYIQYSDLTDWKIVGAQAPWQGSAPFMRARPIVQNNRGELFTVIANGETDLHPLTKETLGDEGLCRFDPIPMSHYAEVWLLRSSFPFQKDALADAVEAKITLSTPILKLPEGVAWMVVRMDADAEQVLTEWCDRAAEESVEAGSLSYGADSQIMHIKAMNCAGLSFSLCNASSKSGLYLAILEVVGRTDWHNQTVKMLERDRGFHFLQSALNHKNAVLARVYRQRSESLLVKLNKQELLT